MTICLALVNPPPFVENMRSVNLVFERILVIIGIVWSLHPSSITTISIRFLSKDWFTMLTIASLIVFSLSLTQIPMLTSTVTLQSFILILGGLVYCSITELIF